MQPQLFLDHPFIVFDFFPWILLILFISICSILLLILIFKFFIKGIISLSSKCLTEPFHFVPTFVLRFSCFLTDFFLREFLSACVCWSMFSVFIQGFPMICMTFSCCHMGKTSSGVLSVHLSPFGWFSCCGWRKDLNSCVYVLCFHLCRLPGSPLVLFLLLTVISQQVPSILDLHHSPPKGAHLGGCVVTIQIHSLAEALWGSTVRCLSEQMMLPLLLYSDPHLLSFHGVP